MPDVDLLRTERSATLAATVHDALLDEAALPILDDMAWKPPGPDPHPEVASRLAPWIWRWCRRWHISASAWRAGRWRRWSR